MTLTGKDATNVIRQALGGELSDELDPYQLINDAGKTLVNMRDWRWLKGHQVTLDLRAQITLTAATWTEATKTLTKTGAFSAYTHLVGDALQITSGTGATVDTYIIASKTSANAIVLRESIGSAADGSADIAATIDLDGVALPDDFKAFVGLEYTDSIVGNVSFIDLPRLQRLRQQAVEVDSPTHFSVALSYGQRESGDGAPVARLELWPTPQDDVKAAFTLFYDSDWAKVDNDDKKLNIPEWIEPLYREVLKAFAWGTEMEEGGSVDERLAKVMLGPIYRGTVAREAEMQFELGPITGGGAQRTARRRTPHYLHTKVAAPSEP